MESGSIDLDKEIDELSRVLLEHPAHVEKVLKTVEFDKSALRYIDAILDHHLKQIYRNLTSNSPLHTLSLLQKMASWNNGLACVRVFQAIDWNSKIFIKMLQLPNQIQNSRKGNKRLKITISKKRSSLLLLFITFFRLGTPEIRLEILNSRKLTTPLFKGIYNDEPSVLKELLQCWLTYVLLDHDVSRATKLSYFNEWSLSCLASLYSRDDEIDGISLCNLVHKFFVDACTVPGEGLCFVSNGWHLQKKVDGQSKTIFNRVLQSFVFSLHVHTSTLQRELVLKILKACPDITASFIERNSLTSEPVLSYQWISFVSLLQAILGMGIPFPFYDAETRTVPPTNIIIENILPSSFSKPVVLKALNGNDKFVCFLTVNTLLASFKRLESVLDEIKRSELSEDNKVVLVSKISDAILLRLPDSQTFVQLYSSTESDLLKEGLSRILLYFFTYFPENILKLKIDTSIFLRLDLSPGMLDRPFSRLHVENIIQILRYLPEVKWFDVVRSPFVFLCLMYLQTSHSKLRDAIVSTLNDVFSQTIIFCPSLAVPPILTILASLQHTSPTQHKAVLEFLNSCINRCISRVFAYLDVCVDCFKKHSVNSQKKTAPEVSPISVTLIEQIPFLLQKRDISDDSKDAVLSWLSDLFSNLVCTGEDANCLFHLLENVNVTAFDSDYTLKPFNQLMSFIESLAVQKLPDYVNQIGSLSQYLLYSTNDELSNSGIQKFGMNLDFLPLYVVIITKRIAIMLQSGDMRVKKFLELIRELVKFSKEETMATSQSPIRTLLSACINLRPFLLQEQYISFNMDFAEFLIDTNASIKGSVVNTCVLDFLYKSFSDKVQENYNLIRIAAKFMLLWTQEEFIGFCKALDSFLLENDDLIYKNLDYFAPLLFECMQFTSTTNANMFSNNSISVLLKAAILKPTKLTHGMFDALNTMKPIISDFTVFEPALHTVENFDLTDCADEQILLLSSFVNFVPLFRKVIWNLLLNNKEALIQKYELLAILCCDLAKQYVAEQSQYDLERIRSFCSEVVENNLDLVLQKSHLIELLFPLMKLSDPKIQYYVKVSNALSEKYLPQGVLELLVLLQKRIDIPSSLRVQTIMRIFAILTRVLSDSPQIGLSLEKFLTNFEALIKMNVDILRDEIDKSTLNSFLESAIVHVTSFSNLRLCLTLAFTMTAEQCDSSRFLQMILAHEKNPLAGEDSSDEIKATMSAIICKLTIIGKNYTLSVLDQILKLFKGRYTLHDSLLCELLAYFETLDDISVASRYKGWVITDEYDMMLLARKDGSGVLEPKIAANTVNQYPSEWEKIDLKVFDDLETTEGLLSSYCSNEWNREVYHPLYALGITASLLHSNQQVSNIQVIVQQNFLGMIVMGLSLFKEEARFACLNFLRNFIPILDEQKFREKHLIKLVLASIIVNVPSSENRLSTLMANFYAFSLTVMMKPTHPLFVGINRYYLQRQHVDVTDIPMYYELLYPSTDYTKSVYWLLTLLHAGLQTNQDLKIYLRRHVFEMICTLYNSCVVNSEIRTLIEKILLKVVALGGGPMLVKYNAIYPMLQMVIPSFQETKENTVVSTT
ncbi:Ribosome biogenesis protein Urb1 [Schizosaccharomyces pombe]